ncbi:MAG: hypothetical protein HYR91_05100 [Flavobacteriia bacterium]|nr:hypothetical protein [Flavobacteriia bacterium]
MWKNNLVLKLKGIDLSLPVTTNLLLKTGIFFTYLGHGLVAIKINAAWFPLMEIYGFTPDGMLTWMPLIGLVDLIVAIIILFYPIRIIVMWAIFWAFITALSRPLAGQDVLEFIERTPNWLMPAILLMRQGLPTKIKHLFYT